MFRVKVFRKKKARQAKVSGWSFGTETRVNVYDTPHRTPHIYCRQYF